MTKHVISDRQRVSVTTVTSVIVDETWSPVIRILRRSAICSETRTPFLDSRDGDGDDHFGEISTYLCCVFSFCFFWVCCVCLWFKNSIFYYFYIAFLLALFLSCMTELSAVKGWVGLDLDKPKWYKLICPLTLTLSSFDINGVPTSRSIRQAVHTKKNSNSFRCNSSCTPNQFIRLANSVFALSFKKRTNISSETFCVERDCTPTEVYANVLIMDRKRVFLLVFRTFSHCAHSALDSTVSYIQV